MESQVVLPVVTNIIAISHQSPRATLNSWKEIAQYLRMGVRTVQRYEAHLNLPIHRVAGKNHSSVFAFCDEIDQWLVTSPTRSSVKASRACDAFSSFLESLRKHAIGCPRCAALLEPEHSVERMAS